MNPEGRALLAVPACGKGMGGGHISRCMALVRGLRALGRKAWLFLPSGAGSSAAHEWFDQSWIVSETNFKNIQWECIILDAFQTNTEELEKWKKLAPVIGIDEGGSKRDFFDFLIDILPGLARTKANISDLSLLPLPKNRNLNFNCSSCGMDKRPLKVLISFGQEDSAGLGLAAAQSLAAHNNSNMEITLLQKNSFSHSPSLISPSVKIIKFIPNLAEHLCEYQLLITHYGLSAFEALYAGTPVLLINPTSYHEALAKAAGFMTVTIKNVNKIAEDTFLQKLKEGCRKLTAKYNLDLPQKQDCAGLINSFSPNASPCCRVCGFEWHNPVFARLPDRTYRRCIRCGIISMSRLSPVPVAYGKEYFFEQYQKQYGKTYIEDFPNLKKIAQRRISTIRKIGNTAPSSPLLDIGCAYGPFLAAAKEQGFSPIGIDPSQDAVNYVTGQLGLPAVHGFFPVPSIYEVKYNVVTLWFVIEHFPDCTAALAEIQKILNPGGVMAFSTPSFSGISGRRSVKTFLARSPADHWTVWSPAACKKALNTAGFKVIKTVICGHHPERFPLLGKFAKSKKSPLYWLLFGISRLFSLGDTFEVYAVNTEKEK